MSFSIDTSEVRALVRDMGEAEGVYTKNVRAVIHKGAGNIKRQQRAEMARSAHFKGAARTIDYDIVQGGAFGGGFIEAQIGPSSGPGKGSGAIANIAYFGSSRGGGTVQDPSVALRDEEEKFIAALEALSDGLL
jgi:hypothetical protein